MTKLTKIEGVGKEYAQKLKDMGVGSVEALLERGGTPKGRQEIVEQSGISSQLILKWVNRADLFRVKGVSEEYGDLLEIAGVDTVPELAQRNPGNLYAKLIEVNEEKKLVRRPPSQSQVRQWVEHAKELPRAISY